MPLYELSDGLLGTHVTWQDVESEVQKVYGVDATFGSNRKVIDIGEMKGFLSKIGLIHTDYSAEPQIVVKIASALSLHGMLQLVSTSQYDIEKMKQMEKVVRDYHTREVLMYRIIEREQPNCPVIKILSMRDFESSEEQKAFILSRFIPGLEHIGMHNNLSVREIRAVVDGIAAFSAMGQKMTEEERAGTIGETYLEDAFKNFYADNNPEEMKHNFLKVLGEEYSEKVEIALQIFDEMIKNEAIQKNYSKISDFLGHTPVLQHSDIWPSNMLFSRNPASKSLELRAIIDFQTASLTSPALDLACLLATCLSKSDRRSHKNELLKRYYEKFSESLNGEKLPFSMEQLERSYELCLPAATFLALPFILSLSMKVGDTVPEESIDKMIGLIEDLAVYHESNKLKFPSFFE